MLIKLKQTAATASTALFRANRFPVLILQYTVTHPSIAFIHRKFEHEGDVQSEMYLTKELLFMGRMDRPKLREKETRNTKQEGRDRLT